MNNPLIKRVLFCLNSQKLNEIIANKHKKKIKQEILKGGGRGVPPTPHQKKFEPMCIKNNRGTSWLDWCLCLFLESTCKLIPQIIYWLARSISTARIFLLCHGNEYFATLKLDPFINMADRHSLPWSLIGIITWHISSLPWRHVLNNMNLSLQLLWRLWGFQFFPYSRKF